ncbi:hypothetical protein B0T10DRAFT_470409 [Thelonectria olida]|uniref:Spc7 kinetochore protein domain-containing protein n=1 Tax=Thelonectria olida TaxID=1576542 RepID=A0A9P9AXM9_9HYPO|nr:hypothetical protein B0T10DRAFT_470409 [Thelonectria olida]
MGRDKTTHHHIIAWGVGRSRSVQSRHPSRMAPSGESTLPATRRVRKSISSHTDIRRAMEKENATVDVSTLAANRKKSRSKSLGPGGLDALRKGSGNRRASLAVPPMPRSILKQTIPSLAEIPPLKPKEPDLIDLGEPTNSQPTGNASNASKVAVRTEEEQQAAAREREERDRRDARRKSLANRRVSFAAEATLHTFHEIEYMQESDAARRKAQNAQDDNEEHQKKQRRSSGLPPLNFHDSEDDTNASSVYSDDSADAVEEVNEVEDDEDSNSDSDDGTMMTIDTEEVTGTTAASDRSADEADESSTIDEALREAARRAGTQRLGDDESEEDLDDGEEFIPMFGWGGQGNKQNIAAQDQENRPLPSQPQSTQESGNDDTETGMDMDMDMDMTRAVGGILKSAVSHETEPEEDMTMEVTRALGGIVSQSQPSKQQNAHATTADEDEVEDDDESMEEATMEFTTAIGGIQRSMPEDNDESDTNEDMSMELTTVMGGVLSQKKRKSMAARRRTVNNTQNLDGDDTAMDMDMDMDMTMGVGRILSASRDQEEEEEEDDGADATMGMEMTMAIGGIINNGVNGSRGLGKQIMEQEADMPDSPVKAVMATVNQASPQKQRASQPEKEATPELISPGLSAFHGKGLRRSIAPLDSSPLRTPSPAKSPSRPQSVSRKAATPSPAKAVTPRTGSASKRVAPRASVRNSRSASPRRPSPAKSNSRTPSPVKSAQKNRLFQQGASSGNRTPTVVLTPQARRLSGLGVDRAGLGSPQVAALFDRRGSIGDMASEFVPGRKGVAFQDPKEMAQEVDQERQDEEDREDRRKILEREADGSQDDREATLNLREMIASMSPKRKPLKGRKSLHVGSAKGILGKRPNELDSDEEAEENDGVKRLKGHQSSPVKNVKLQQPPSKAETTGRLTKSLGTSLQLNGNISTPTLSSPTRPSPVTTPKGQGRFKTVKDDRTDHSVDFGASTTKDATQLENEADEDRIHLQDFLNMTSIRFMELTTTKRRQTVAGALPGGYSAEDEGELSLERCVVAGACTVPMLELYQHSCRELKKYISEGRRMVKEIETDTFEENPPLFREYMAATPEVKGLMDNQFKNVKTHARLLSKAMWYEWRMKLQDGLKEGLLRIDEGMEADKEVLDEQTALLGSVMPPLQAHHDALVEESGNLEEIERELADCDPSELEDAREELSSLDADIEHKKRLIARLREEFQASEADVESLTLQKKQYLEDIKESEKVREECRGWTSTEVNSLKARADAIENEHGWSMTGISGTMLSLAYKREIEMVFDIASFKTRRPNARIDLWYIGDTRERDPVPMTAEKEFLLECIRDHVRALPQSRTKTSHLLGMVAAAWDQANDLSSRINRLNVTFPTTVRKTSDSSVAVTTSLLLVPLETRVEATLHIMGQSGPDSLDVAIAASAKVIYGEHFNVAKVGEFLNTRLGKQMGDMEEEWSDIMVELHARLIARGRK